MKVDSQEFKDLMRKWSEDAYKEELGNAIDEYYAHEDMMGRLPGAAIAAAEVKP